MRFFRSLCALAMVTLLVLGALSEKGVLKGATTDSDGLLGYIQQLPDHGGRSWLSEEVAKFREFPRLDLAFRLIKEGRVADAKAELDRLLARDPNDVAAQSVEMTILQQDKDYKGVIRLADRLLARYSSFAPALMYRALALQALGQNEASLQDWLHLTALKGLNVRDYVFGLDTVVDLSLHTNHYGQALRAAEKLVAFKRDFYLYYRKNLALQGLGRLDEASVALATAVKLAPNEDERATLLKLAGDLSYGQRDWKAAEAAYQRALDLRPSDPDILRRLSHTSYQMRDYSGAIERMKPCVTFHHQIQDRQYLANVMVAAKDYAGAEQQLRVILTETQDAKDAIPVYRQLIEVARMRRDNVTALRFLRSLLRLQAGPREQELLLTLLQQQKDYPAMIEELKRIVSRRSGDSATLYEAYIELGNIYELERQFDQASEAFAQAVKLNRSAQALGFVAESLSKAGRNEDAIRYTEQVLDIQPSAELYVRLAVLYTRVRNTRRALECLGAALEKNPPPDVLQDIYRKQGFLFVQSGQLEDAEAAFSRALERNPANPELQTAIAELCIERREFKRAVSYLEQISQSQKSANATRMLAFAYAGEGDLVRAAVQYEELFRSEPHPSQEAEQAGVSLAYLEARQGKFDNSARHFLRAFEYGGSQHANLLLKGAQQFVAAQKNHEAIQAYKEFLNSPAVPIEAKGGAWEELGYTYTKTGNNRSATEAFRKALESGRNSKTLHKSLAYSYYALQEWTPALGEFLSTEGQPVDSTSLMEAAWCYKHLNKPGLSIYYFNEALKTSSLNDAERVSILNELGDLYYSVEEDMSAAAVWQESLQLAFQPSICLTLAQTRARRNDFSGAELALARVKAEDFPIQGRVTYFDQVGLLAKERGDIDASTSAYRQSNHIAPAAWRDYQLGLNEMQAKRYVVSISYFSDALEKDPSNTLYMRELAYAFQRAGDLPKAERVFEKLARLDTQKTYWYKSVAYTNLKMSRNVDAANWFRKAIDSNDPSGSSDTWRDDYQMRSEMTTLTRTYELSMYQGVVSNSYTRPGAIALSGDPFPASSGIEFAYRPPAIGLRNGRTFQLVTRLLWRNDSNVPAFNTKYYQSSVGVRYKPFVKQNLWVSAERLLHTGTSAYHGWMFRGMYSWNPGFELKPGRKMWNYSLAFGDSVYLPQGSHLFAQYGEFRRGLSFNIRNTFVITPLFVADARWQNQQLFDGTRAGAGGGLSVRYLYNSSRYEIHRSSFELLLECKRGNVFSSSGGIGYSGCSALGIFRF